MKRKVIENKLKAADAWEKKGNHGWVVTCLSGVLLNYLSIGVTEREDLGASCGWWKHQGVEAILGRYMEHFSIILEDVSDGKLPASGYWG